MIKKSCFILKTVIILIMEPKLIVIAIGGNSLIEDSKNVSVKTQYEATIKTAKHIVKLLAEGHHVVIAHGNGPQVGYILRRAEYSKDILHTVPLDSCVADTQGAIGYQLQKAIYNEMKELDRDVDVATVVTQVVVDKNDIAFSNPTKPIGSFMTREQADERIEKDNWTMKEDSGRGYRRVVASPKPKQILELNVIKKLLNNEVVVIAVGGGGIPVTIGEHDEVVGCEAVIDKDLAACMLAKELKADAFIISTAVEKVCLNYGKENQKDLSTMTIADIDKYIEEGHFAPGSMLPKIQAIRDYVSSTNNVGIITDPSHIYEALTSTAGTRVLS